MKTLYLIRHAKSSWETGQPDFDRPLNPRGLRDAPRMAAYLKQKGVRPDLLITSSAARAKLTSQFFAQALDIPKSMQWETKELYHASMLEILDVVCAVPDEYDTILLFGHNPGFTYFANEFWGENWIDNLPTCGVVEIAGEVSSWTMFTGSTARVVGHYFPKEIK
ncbi:MAG TPA: hypothetical protein ENK85_10470 [Saprospiraceae bacterium]|nr:hypothetical protein [Saprospiraceae bacterium]